MANAKAQLASEFSPQFRAYSRSSPIILVAEDSADGREMLSTLLRLKGYQVVTAENGIQAIQVALASSPDLILIDLQLPRLSGIDVARNLKLRRDFRDIPIVVVSGHNPSDYREDALNAGCTDCLVKPIDFERLDIILTRSVPINY
jgi:CheY-like chemotaxis protein